MKLLVSLMIAGSALLIAGGDIMPVEVVTKYEKPSVKCYKPNIQKCPDCDDVAEICPDDPTLPMAKTEPCSVDAAVAPASK
ncbi:hypothetical protein KKC13_11670 [bacterium]|nr:hypothetical protein [bacterium]MBU1957539.1 hypothetical protein [bacterium]